MPVFDLDPRSFPMLTPQQTSPLGGVLSDAIAKRLKMAQTEKEETEAKYSERKSLADILHQELLNKGQENINKYYGRNIESEIGLRGTQSDLAKQEILQKKLDYEKAKKVRNLFNNLNPNAPGQLPGAPSSSMPSAQPQASMSEINIPQILGAQLNAPAKQNLSSSLAQTLASQQQGLGETPSIPEMPAIGQYLQQQESPAQTQEVQQGISQQNQQQVINPGRPELSYMDEQYDKNPLLRSELEKYGLKKKTEIKFDNKTGQTRIITTYPSGKMTLQTSSLGQASNGIPLTNNQVTKHQNVISSVDVVKPVLEKIKNLDKYPLWSLPNWAGGSANESAIYSGLVNQALDSLIGAFGMPKTNEGLKSVRDQLEIHHLESPKAYKKRLTSLIEDLESRRKYSANEVKKSNAIQPVGRSEAGSDSYGLGSYDNSEES